MNYNNVYSGDNAVIDYLTPDNNNPTPLVEIPHQLNPFRNDGVRIFAKLMNETPLGNVKSLPALNMLQGNTEKTHTIVENSSGNTVMSLGVIARLHGIPHTKAYASHQVSSGKLQLLQLMGIEPIINNEPICPDPNDKESGIYKAKQDAQQEGWLNPGQYDNEKNPQAHYKWTGPQIWVQTDGAISIFCSGLGTTGTMVGTASYLKEQNQNIKTIGVVRSPNNPVPGVRTPNLLGQIAFDWKSLTDHLEHIGTQDSYVASCELCRHGLFVGPSSGFAYKGLLSFLEKSFTENKLDTIRNEANEIVCVFICCDSPLPYLSEYFEYLPPSMLPKIENFELLENDSNSSLSDISHNKREITINEFCNKYLNKPVSAIHTNQDITFSEKVQLIDVRTKHEYEDAHIQSAIHIENNVILENIDRYQKQWSGKTIVTICRSGGRSLDVTKALVNKDIDTYSLAGGMIEWSQLGLPRVQPRFCQKK